MAEHWTIDRPTTLDVGGDGVVRRLMVGVVGGRVDVVTHEGSTARVEVHELSGRPLLVDWNGSELEVGYENDGASLLGFLRSRRDNRDRVRLSIAVPAGTEVLVSTVSAEAVINGVRGGVTANTVSGELTLDDLVGTVKINTVSGDVDAHGLDGALTGNSVSGALTVQASRLRNVKVTSVSGDVALDLTDGRVEVQAKAVSGDVTVRVPPGGGYDISSHAASGYVEVDGRRVQPAGFLRGGGTARDGDGGLVIKAQAVSGNVIVLRSALPQENKAG